jgi:hypothetical protein
MQAAVVAAAAVPQSHVDSQFHGIAKVQVVRAWEKGLAQYTQGGTSSSGGTSTSSSSSGGGGTSSSRRLLLVDDLGQMTLKWSDMLGEPLGAGGEGMAFELKGGYEVLLRHGSTSATEIRVPVAIKVTKLNGLDYVHMFKAGIEKAAAIAAATPRALPPMAALVQPNHGWNLPEALQKFLGGCSHIGITLMPQLLGSVTDEVAPLHADAAKHWESVALMAVYLQWTGLDVLVNSSYHPRDFKGPNVLYSSTGEMWLADTG